MSYRSQEELKFLNSPIPLNIILTLLLQDEKLSVSEIGGIIEKNENSVRNIINELIETPNFKNIIKKDSKPQIDEIVNRTGPKKINSYYIDKEGEKNLINLIFDETFLKNSQKSNRSFSPGLKRLEPYLVEFIKQELLSCKEISINQFVNLIRAKLLLHQHTLWLTIEENYQEQIKKRQLQSDLKSITFALAFGFIENIPKNKLNITEKQKDIFR
jgi:hypothetical protein